ncbi:hypothetical protein BME96_00900 [Virgibacillus halodenitrificans]|uniref:Uncharacterized protein n=1 Tax=Virgibacillus halodenitrificans TaxID=1482 RepID=A0AAC9IUF7_VIRHA|nr:hypothetical protein BME96_00900 [Virgibacillus halodenitrificans]
MSISRVILREVVFFIVVTLFMFGITTLIDNIRGHAFEWESNLLICILTVFFIRVFMLITKTGSRKKDNS